MKVAFIGIGAIGWPMAATLVKAGYEVVPYDVDKERLARFATEHHCRAAATIAEVAAHDFVIAMLPNGEIVRHVFLSAEDGVFLKTVKPGTIVIDMGSSDPLGTRALGAALRERGAALIDAPVSKRATVFAASGTPQATASAIPMVIMIGGDDQAAIAKAKPVLAAIGDTLFETGALGSGHAVKALNNYASAASHVGLGEALLAAERFGLDPKTFIDVINVSTGRSFVSEVLIKKHLDNKDFKAGFSVGLFAKDIKNAVELMAAVHLDAPVARLVGERWASARDKLGAATDLANAVPAWDDDLPT